MTEREKVIKGLRQCVGYEDVDNKYTCIYDGDTNPNCPYGKTGGDEVSCMTKMMRDALTLLKAQEPRVMTLEEVTEDKPDVVWFDDRHYKLTYPAFVSNGEVTGWIVSLSNGCLERHDHIDGYGKEWRCWTSRPTDEQREKVKWE